MIYYSRSMELEVISELFRGTVNDALVCRDRLSASGARYLLLVIHDRNCAKQLLTVFEDSERAAEEPPYLERFAQNEQMIYVFPYREERKFSSFARGQMVTRNVGEEICINLVMECMSSSLPWPLLYLVLIQDCVQIAKDNSIYFTLALDLEDLDDSRGERTCVSCCAGLLLELLEGPVAGTSRKRGNQKLKSFELIRKKSGKNAYGGFPELYRDIKVTALPNEKESLMARLKGSWRRNRDGLFRILLWVCGIVVAIALIMLISQLVFGDIPLLRLFHNCFDVIGTENLHRGG